MHQLNYWKACWLALCLVAVSGAMCQQVNPIAAAETVEQRAYAAYGSFVIFQEKAVDLVDRPNISREVKLRIINAEDRAKPIADDMLDVLQEYLTIRNQVDLGETPAERLVAVSNNLNNWINRLMPLVNDLIRTVQEAED